jgi:hypothetical protein
MKNAIDKFQREQTRWRALIKGTFVPVLTLRLHDHEVSLSLFLDRCSSTTLLVSPRTKRLDLLGLQEPEDEILEEPEEYLSMHARQRASRHRGGEKPLQEAKATLIDKA